MYSTQEVLQFVLDEDVKFIRLIYFDVFGRQKNVSILPGRLKKAFEKGIAIDSSAVAGFGTEHVSDLFLRPDPSTMTIMPWRSMNGCVIYMICDILHPDGTLFELDTRYLLKKSISKAASMGLYIEMAAKFEFYLFCQDAQGNPTRIPIDRGSYMDVSPLDKGENVRREICLTLDEMGMEPHKSYHQSGPGQNEIDFHFSRALQAADDASIFKWVVSSVADGNGIWADFTPKPLDGKPGNSMRIQIRFLETDKEKMESFAAGILHRIQDVTLFCNPTDQSYVRFGQDRAPLSINWSDSQRNVLMRIPPLNPDTIELRSPDCTSNPYLVFALLIEAGIEGVRQNRSLEPLEKEHECSWNHANCQLPADKKQAIEYAGNSDLVRRVLDEKLIEAYMQGDI